MKRRHWLQSGLPWLAVAWWGVPAWAGPTGSTIAARFGKLPPPERVRRVFAAGAPAGVLLAALAPDKLVGWPLQLSDAARGLLGAPLQGLPFVGRLAGRGSTVPMETLVQLQPDLILDSGTADATTSRPPGA